MTVSTTSRLAGPFTGTGADATLPFAFKAFAPTDVVVTRDGTTLTPTTHYTVSLNADQNAAPGGTVTILAAANGVGVKVYVGSQTGRAQAAVLPSQGKWSPKIVEHALDRAMVVAQEQDETLSRVAVLPHGESFSATLPSKAELAGKALGFDDAGNPIAVPVSEADVAASVAAAQLAAATADAARIAAQSAKAAAENDASAAHADRLLADANAVAATAAANTAATAAVLAGAYPNSAGSYVPRGLTQASVGVLTAGSGGANGTFALGWSGGNFSIPPSGTFTVAGGIVTTVTITGPGLYIGPSPVVPTPIFSASSGLTGANVAMTAQFLIASGGGYWVQSSDNTRLDRYYNSGGTATPDVGTGPIVTSTGLNAATSGVVGGRKNLFPDPFFNNYGRWEQMGSGTLPYAVSNWTIETPRSSSPYQDGQQARAAGNTGSAGISHYLPNLGLAVGDQFQYAWAAARASGSTTNGIVFATYVFLGIDGSVITGSTTLFTSVTGTLLDTTSKAFVSSTITVPAGAYSFVVILANFAAVNVYVDAIWMHKTSVPSAPLDNAAIPNGITRVAALEDASPSLNKNNVLLKRVTYSSRTVALAGASGSTTFSNNTGFSQSLLSSGAPVGGFNAVEMPIAWIIGSTAPSRFYADVRTLNASAAKHPSSGRVVARGWIDVDPTSGGGETYVILLRDPITGAVKTVFPADLDDRYTIALYGVKADGSQCGSLFVSLGTGSVPNLDTTYPHFYNALPNGGGSNTSSGFSFGANHLLLTSPAEAWKTASSEFASSVAQAGQGTPLLIAAPQKLYGVVGREARMFWAQIQRRDPRDVNFSVPTLPSGASVVDEGIKWTPTGASTTSVTITSSLGNNPSDSKTVSFVSVAASAAPGTKACLFMGDSLIGNGAMLTALSSIDASDAVTNLSFLGTQGSTYKNEGYSGTSLGSFFGATLAGGATNPFYGGGTFSFSTWLANGTIAAQLSAAGKTEPDFVFIEAGKVDTGSAASDGAAQALATTVATNLEMIIATIKAATTTTKVVVYSAEPGPMPTGENIGYGPLWRVRRNWMILAQNQISQFSGREASRIYVTATGCSIDALTGWPRTFAPRSNAIWKTGDTTFASYSGMSLGYAAGTVAYATDVAQYFVKMGNSGSGFWRPAQESDGFAWRSADSIHYANGAIQVAEANWALIKNVG